MHLKNLQKRSFEIAKNKGFWDEYENPGEKIALIHAELSEALEELRKPNFYIYYELVWSDEQSDYIRKPEGLPIELADAIIRILEFAEYFGIDLEQAIKIKEKYNKGRSYKHGKAF